MTRADDRDNQVQREVGEELDFHVRMIMLQSARPIAAVAGVLPVVGVVASAVPARRAAKIDLAQTIVAN